MKMVSVTDTHNPLLEVLRQSLSKARMQALSKFVLERTELIKVLFQIIETQSSHDAMLASWLLCHLHEADDNAGN